MKSTCLSDRAIQTYAFELSACDTGTLSHVAICEKCKLRVGQYKSLSAAIDEEVDPEIGIDIASLILEKVEKDARIESLHSAIMYALLAISVAVIASLIILFRSTIGSLLPHTEAFGVSFVLSTALTALFLLSLDLVRSYREKERMLDY